MKNHQAEPERSCGWVPASAAGSEPAAPLEQCSRQSWELWKWTKGLLFGKCSVVLSSWQTEPREGFFKLPLDYFSCRTDLTWSFLLCLWFYWFKVRGLFFGGGCRLGIAQRYKPSSGKVRLYRTLSSQRSSERWTAFSLIVLFYCI